MGALIGDPIGGPLGAPRRGPLGGFYISLWGKELPKGLLAGDAPTSYPREP